jgi:hypothetical protein
MSLINENLTRTVGAQPPIHHNESVKREPTSFAGENASKIARQHADRTDRIRRARNVGAGLFRMDLGGADAVEKAPLRMPSRGRHGSAGPRHSCCPCCAMQLR